MTRLPRQAETGGAARAAGGFTLVELLVVIGIIVLLVGIMAPAVMTAGRLIQALKSHRRIAELSQGALGFQKDKGYFPGQRGFAKDADGNDYTGSQQLAYELFGPDLTKPNTYYASCMLHTNNSKSDLFDPFLVSDKYAQKALPDSISDRYGVKPMAILYFPARRGAAAKDQYVQNDNTPYLVSSTLGDGSFDAWLGGSFTTYIKDTRLGVPYNQNRFIMIAAGMDRKYGTDDDKKNF